MTSLSLLGRFARFVLITFVGVGLALPSIASNITYEYTDGRLTKLTYDNGTVVQYTYDANGNRTGTQVTLPTPANLIATATSQTQVEVTWSASGGSTLYELERCTGAGCSDFSTVSSPATTPYLDIGLTHNTTYRYRARTYDAAGNYSNYAAIASVTTAADATAPTTPSNLSATAVGANINLSWIASTDSGGAGLSGYKIERCEGASCSGFAQIDVSAGESYQDTSATPGSAYRYRVRAYDGAGNNSGYSNIANVSALDTVAPSAPTGLAASSSSSTSVSLSWNASTDNVAVTGYRVYRNGTQVGTLTVSAPHSGTVNYTDTSSLQGSTTYTYTVRAYDAASNLSGQSNQASVTTPDTIAPSVPTGLSGTAASGTKVNLTWNASSDTGGSGLAGYRVYRNGTHIATRTVTNYSDTPLSPATTYTYRVAARDDAENQSAQSTAVSVTTLDTIAPSVPTNVATTVLSDTQVKITWTKSTDTGTGVAKYRVYRGGTYIGEAAATNSPTFTDSNVSPFNTYSYTVRARDVAGNESASSSAATAVTSRQITNSSGNVLSGAPYVRTITCPYQNTCIWYVRKNYGDNSTVVAVQGTTSIPCTSGSTTNITQGYQRSGCVLRAAPSKYGN